MTGAHTCYCCEQVTDRAMSTAPVMALLRILELCWRERHALPADVVERIREQLQGPAGDRARADVRVLDAMSEWPEADLRDPLDAPPPSQRAAAWRTLIALCKAELARRGLKP